MNRSFGQDARIAEQFFSLLGVLQDEIWICDKSGNVQYVNDVAVKRLKVSAADDLTGPAAEVFSSFTILDSEGRPRNPEDIPLLRALRGERSYGEEESLVLPGDEGFMIRKIFASPVNHDTGGVVGAIAVVQDVTAIKRIEADLERYREELDELVNLQTADLSSANRKLEHEVEERRKAEMEAERANQAKNNFLANISHEMRNPLNGILGMTTLAMAKNRQRDVQEYLDLIKSSADQLTALINDILDISRIESGKFKLEPVPFEIRSLLDSIVKPLMIQADEKGVGLRSHVAKDVPVSLVGDPHRIGQIISNLIGNAVKFTEEGFVSVEVRSAEDSGWYEFVVSDTGIGIPEDLLKDIFESFRQLDASYSKKYQGAGLGLAISERLVSLMGGRIEVESQEGKGSTFSFAIPLPEHEVEQPEETAGEASGAEGGEGVASWLPPLKILLAEDQKVNRLFMERVLTDQGHTVVSVENGKQALDALRKGSFDLVLMDVQMPEMNGLEATTRIREDGSGEFDSRIPIIALTGYAMKGDRENFLKSGMDAFIPKPIELDLLNRTVLQIFSER